MNEIESFVAEAREGIRIQKAQAEKMKELGDLAERAKKVRADIEGAAWSLLQSIRERGQSADVDLQAISYLFESLNLDAASEALQTLRRKE